MQIAGRPPDSRASFLSAGDGDEVLAPAPGTPVDTNGVQGADEVAPADAAVEEDPNGTCRRGC